MALGLIKYIKISVTARYLLANLCKMTFAIPLSSMNSKVQMNVFLGLAFIAAVITNAYAIPLLSEGDEETNQIREKLFLAKLSNLIKARKQETVRSSPHLASSLSLMFIPFP